MAFLAPLTKRLDQHLDSRLARMFLATATAILTFRNRALGLLLTEQPF